MGGSTTEARQRESGKERRHQCRHASRLMDEGWEWTSLQHGECGALGKNAGLREKGKKAM